MSSTDVIGALRVQLKIKWKLGLLIVFWLLQFDVIKRYIDGGGSVLVMLGEGGESRFETNINFFLEEFGINVNTG